jgi:Mg-chelatase subunit ChlI
MERTCPNCGTVNYDDQAMACVNCGGELPLAEGAPAPEREAPEVPEGKLACPECGALVNVGAKRCPSCDADLGHIMRCPSCGKGVDEIAEICPNCFNALPKGDEAWDAGAVGGAAGAGPEPAPPVEGKPAEEPAPEPVKKVKPEPAKPAPKRAPKREEPDEDLDEEDLARQRRDERKRKIKDILEEEKGESPLNYYRLSLIPLFFFVFLAIFTVVEFVLFAFNVTNSVPGALLVFAPMLGGSVSIEILTIALVLTVFDAVLHVWDRKLNLWLSFVPTGLLITGLAVAVISSTGAYEVDIYASFAVLGLLFLMVILDLICLMNYPAALEDPGRSQFELYIDKEDEFNDIRTELEEEKQKMLEEEEEKLRLKDEEMREIQQRLEQMSEKIAQEEERVRLKEQEISEIRSELEMKTEQLLAEEEKLRVKEQEMESLVRSEVDRRAEEYMMEEEERVRMKEQELIKARSDLEIQRNLFDESREKLRMKEQELSTLKTELENQIRQRLEEEEKLKLKAAAGRMLEKTKQKRVLFPFVSLVGQEKMKKAMVLNAIYPEIGGVLIRGQKGTGKSVGVRGLAEVLPDIDVTGCKFNCDPSEPDRMCAECSAKNSAGKLETYSRPVQVVDLPLNITEDRLVGSIDIEKILSEGTKSFDPGILAEAHRGILYVDEINLLDDYIVDILLDSASSGNVNVEREGISISHPARFIIVGSMNPEEGELRPQILDRIALQTDVVGIQDVTQRIEIVKRREEFTRDPEAFRGRYEPSRKELRERITKARELLPSVSTPKHIYDLIAQVCIDFNVDGHRADIIIERAARANAAFEGRLESQAEDIVVASEMALPHRMRRRPYEEEEFSEEMLRKLVKKRELEILEGSRKG